MFKNSQKISISKHFLISLLFVILIFTSIGVGIDDACASDMDQTVSGIESELNVEDKLENSQENVLDTNLDEDNSLSRAQDNVVLGNTINLLNGGKFSDIRNAITSANDGDTIKLEGTFESENKYDEIYLTKSISFTSDSMATLDCKNLSRIFFVSAAAKGSSFNNLNIINSNQIEYYGAIHVKAVNVTIKNCIFENCLAYRGAAISTNYNENLSANLLIENCQFLKNHVVQYAGAISVFGDNTRVINCTFDSNTAYNDIDGVIPYGGAIQLGLNSGLARGYVYNCKFYNNYVQPKDEEAHGGAGCVRDGVVYENCIFINNSAAQGGALTYHASGLIKNCTFINNTATEYGGALSTGYEYNKMNLKIEGSHFEGNSAPIGGAVQLIGENVDISDSEFKNNTASQNGGAININAVSVSIKNSSFESNIANVDGGAVFINGTDAQIKDSSFRSNHAIPDADKLDDGLGGAIYINSTKAVIDNNEFYLNTARNGSAIYYDKYGTKLKLTGNTFHQNQAWVYRLPIFAEDIYCGESEVIGSTIYGGNNIAKYGDLAISNAIYNAANNQFIEINGETPVLGATTNGHLYQDDREYNMDVLLTVTHEDGSVVYNKTLKSNCFGEVSDTLNNLKVGKYYVSAVHFEDTYYKAITNATTFSVIPQIDNKVRKAVASEEINYGDIVVWTLNITNNGPNNATNVVIRDILPEGLIYLDDNTNGAYNSTTGTLKIDFLEVGEIYIVKIRTTVNKTGEITNDVNITADEHDHDLTNNHDQSNINVDSACDLAVTKAVNVSVVNLGGKVRWTITVVNNGPDNATGVIARDVLPRSLIWVYDDGLGSYNHNSGEWNIGALNKGSKAILNIDCRVNATGDIKNEVTVSGQQYDYNKANNHDSEIIKVNPACDLGIVKEVSSSVVNYTDVVKWTLTVSNFGPDNATGVKIYDLLPGGFVYLDSSKPYSNGVIDIGDLAVGGKVVVEIYSQANITGSFVNVARVNGSQYDHNPANNRDTASILVKPATDLAIRKEVNESRPNFASDIKWTLIASNNGPNDATGVVVRDILPKSLIWVSDDGLGKYDHNSGVWNIGDLNRNGNVRLTIVCTVNSTGTIENRASISGNEFDWIQSNNNAKKAINVNSACDLGIVKEVSSSVVNYTDVVKWTLTVSNFGPDSATGVKIYDLLPGGFVYLNSTKPYSNGVIDIGDLAVGGKAVVEIYSQANITGSFVNVARVNGGQYDHNPANNRDDASILVKPATDLVVMKSVNNTSPNFADEVKWTIKVVNNGPDNATGVVVNDLLPKSLIWVSDDGLGSYNHDSGVWNAGAINKGQMKTLNIITRVNATGISVNKASVTGNEFDYNKSNNVDNATITVANASDLSVSKLVNASFTNYLQFVKWTIIAFNNGPDKATGVTVDDMLPEGLKVIGYNATKGFYDNGVWALCCLENGESQTLELTCQVTKTGMLTNIVKINGTEYDPDVSNNVANESVLVPPSTDLAVIKNVNNSSPNYGDVIEWSIIVTNNGPDDAEFINVYDVLPKGLEYIDYTSTGGQYSDGLWEIDYLKNGGTESLTIFCVVKALGTIRNSVEVVPSQYDWNRSNNKDSEIITGNPIADLSLIKSVNVSGANYLDLIKWSLVVTNNGPNDATGVFVSDVIPNGLTIVGVFGEGEYVDSIWNVGDLANGKSKQLDIVCKVQATGNFTNVANVWASEPDPDMSNNDDESYLFVYPSSDLSITKTVSKYKYSVGDVISYSIKLTNRGPDVAENIKVREMMDDSLALKSFHASAGDFDKVNDVWSLDFLDAGQSAVLKIKSISKKVGVAKNEVVATNDNFDPDLSNNNASVSVDVSKKQKSNSTSDEGKQKQSDGELKEGSYSILEENKSGNPLMVIVLLFVFTMGAIYGNTFLKKR